MSDALVRAYWQRMTDGGLHAPAHARLARIVAVLCERRRDPMALIAAYDALQFMYARGHSEVSPLLDQYEAAMIRVANAAERVLERRTRCAPKETEG